MFLSVDNLLELILVIGYITWLITPSTSDSFSCNCSIDDDENEDEIDYTETAIEYQKHSKTYFPIIDRNYVEALNVGFNFTKEPTIHTTCFASREAAVRVLKQVVAYYASVEEAQEEREEIDLDDNPVV